MRCQGSLTEPFPGGVCRSCRRDDVVVMQSTGLLAKHERPEIDGQLDLLDRENDRYDVSHPVFREPDL